MLQQGEFNVAVEFTDIHARNGSWKMEMRGVKCHTGTQKIINYFAVQHEFSIFAPFFMETLYSRIQSRLIEA